MDYDEMNTWACVDDLNMYVYEPSVWYECALHDMSYVGLIS